MKVLVTGATGFVGAVLMPELIGRCGPASVSAFVLPGDTIPATWRGSGVQTLAGDISDARAVRTAAAGHSHIVHLAGFISYWKGDEDRLRTVNEDGARSIVEASLAAGVERLIHISSVGAVTAKAISSSEPTSATGTSSGGSAGPAAGRPTLSPSRLPCSPPQGICWSRPPAGPGAGPC